MTSSKVHRPSPHSRRMSCKWNGMRWKSSILNESESPLCIIQVHRCLTWVILLFCCCGAFSSILALVVSTSGCMGAVSSYLGWCMIAEPACVGSMRTINSIIIRSIISCWPMLIYSSVFMLDLRSSFHALIHIQSYRTDTVRCYSLVATWGY